MTIENLFNKQNKTKKKIHKIVLKSIDKYCEKTPYTFVNFIEEEDYFESKIVFVYFCEGVCSKEISFTVCEFLNIFINGNDE